MRKIIKYLFRLLVLLAIGAVVYGFFADLPAPKGERSVTLPMPQADR